MNVKLYYRNRLVFIGILLLLNTGCIRFVTVADDVPEQNPVQLSSNTGYHVVQAGDTLYSIAFEHGRDVRDVAAWNNIGRPYTIYPKQKLRIVPIESDRKNKTVKIKKSGHSVHFRKPISPSRNNIGINVKPVWHWPTQGKISSTFLYRDPGRRGIDIVGRKGQPVYAAAAGTVVYRGNGLRGYGNLIILKHNESYFSAYAHTEHVVVKENEKVKSGQQLADMGSTGTDEIKLHFEIRRNGKPVNPLRYLPKRH